MLLGMDFLHDCKAKLDLEVGTLSLEGDQIIMSCGRSLSSGGVRETHLRGLCLGWHPRNLSGGGRSGCLGTQESWIVSASEEDNEGPLPKLGSWTSKREMVKNPTAFEVSSEGAVDEAPEMESRRKVIRPSTPPESAKGSQRPRRRRGRLRNAPCSMTLEPQPTSV